MIKRILKRILFNLYVINKVAWFKLLKLYSFSATDAIMLWPSMPKNAFGYFFSGTFENDFALMQAMIERNLPFRIVVGGKKLLHINNMKIYFNLSNLFGFVEGENYAVALQNFQQKLINNGNIIVPTIDDSKYWENKIYMHEKFIELDISHPKTIIVDALKKAPTSPNIEFPLLFKPAHASGSTGIVKINNLEEYHQVVSTTHHTEYLIQEWIDMRSDLRLIYIGDELVLHYWRINQGKEWKPTSTGHGSSVDFEMLPDQWMPFIFNEYKKLKINTGAFDITWANDDLSTKPLILEVSPSYMPNPAPPSSFYNKSYSDFKGQIWGKDAYYKKYIDLVFDIKLKLIKHYEQQ